MRPRRMLLPALLAAVGRKIDRFALPLPWRTGEDGSSAFWTRWAQRVMRRPVTALTLGAGETVGLRPLTDIEEGVASFVIPSTRIP